jgi:hypothetical protein
MHVWQKGRLLLMMTRWCIFQASLEQRATEIEKGCTHGDARQERPGGPFPSMTSTMMSAPVFHPDINERYEIYSMSS